MRIFLVLAAAALLDACAGDREQPAGIGSGRDELKRSPCACLELPLEDGGRWREELGGQIERWRRSGRLPEGEGIRASA